MRVVVRGSGGVVSLFFSIVNCRIGGCNIATVLVVAQNDVAKVCVTHAQHHQVWKRDTRWPLLATLIVSGNHPFWHISCLN